MLFARRRSRGEGRSETRMNRLQLESLESRRVLSAADLLPTLAELRASTADVYPADLTLDNQQRVVRQEVNVWGEVDLYSFTPAWTGSYRFTVNSVRSAIDPVIAVYDAGGNRIAFNDDATARTNNSATTATLTAGTVYQFAVTSYDAMSGGRYSASITGVLQDDASENNDSQARASRVFSTANMVINGVMADAHDYYRFSLSAAARTGSSISLKFSDAQGDLDLRLMDARGSVLRTSTGEGDQETIDVSGLVAGRYFVDVYGYQGAYNPSYQLAIDAQPDTAPPPVMVGDRFEPNNTREAAKNLGAITGTGSWPGLSITTGDIDFFQFSLATAGNASSEVLVNLRNSQGDLDAELLDSAGRRIATSQTASDQERLSLNGLAAGTYFVRVYGYNRASNPDYTLAINHVATVTPPVTPPTVGPSLGSWTIMVYMTATNLASYSFNDVNEMEDALTRTAPGVRFTVFWDQWSQSSFATGGGGQAAWGTAGQAVLQADSNMNSVATSFDIIGERNTGDPAALRNFIVWSKTNAPANNYALVMWNHGGGLSGVNFDDESGNDSITVGDLRSAITQAGVPLQVLAYDACLMGMAEQAYETRDLATVLVASEEVIDGPGFDYKTAFQALNSNPSAVTAQSLAQGMVSSFATSYIADGVSTLSAVTGTAMTGFATSLNTFTTAASSLTTANVNTIKTILSGVTHFDFPEYVDLKQFMQRVATTATLPQALRNAASGVVTSVGQAVFTKMADKRQSGGLAIYLPSTAAQESSSYGSFSNFETATRWSSFINRVLGRAIITRLGTGAGLSNAAAIRGAVRSRPAGPSDTLRIQAAAEPLSVIQLAVGAGEMLGATSEGTNRRQFSKQPIASAIMFQNFVGETRVPSAGGRLFFGRLGARQAGR